MNRIYMLCGGAVLLTLSACSGGVKETLGLDQRAPDEFRVVSRPPLSVPPQFDLIPPGTGTSPIVTNASDKAESLVLGKDAPEADNKAPKKTTAEQLFLQKAGYEAADPTIKKQLTEQKIEAQTQKEEEGWWDTLTTLPGNKEPVVKAEDEADRLQKNKAEGKPVNEGKVPETGGGPISVLQRWLE